MRVAIHNKTTTLAILLF